MKNKLKYFGIISPLTVLLAITVLACLFLAGCDTSGDSGTPDNGTVSGPVSEVPALLVPVLGKGYDVTGNYTFSPEIKQPILDLNKLLQADRVERDLLYVSAEFETITGETIKQYQQSLSTKVTVSAKVGVKGVASFSTEVGTSFSEERITNEKYVFATSTTRVVKDAYVVKNHSNLSEFFTASFTSDLASMTNEQLIAKYGTHVMLGAVLGARLDYHLSTEKKDEKSITNLAAYVKANAEATVKGVDVGGGTTTDVEKKYSEYFETTTTMIKTKAVGGRPEFAQNIHEKKDYDAWINSIDANVAWSDYYPGSLIALCDLVADEARSESLAQAIMAHCSGKEFIIRNQTPYIKDIYVGVSTSNLAMAVSNAKAQTTENMTVIEKDLNQGAGGAYIVIGYTITTFEADAMRNITARIGNNPPNSVLSGGLSYDLINVDMNQGASGSYIYLYKTKIPAAGAPLQNLFVEINGETSGMSGSGWSRVGEWDNPASAVEMNRGAGGAHIYIWMKK